jgi:predicted CoA-substrate-specific enzyme activase
MISAGVDVGSKNLHLVIIQDGRMVTKARGPVGTNKAEAADALYNGALTAVGLTRGDVRQVVATGIFGRQVPFMKVYIPDVTAVAKGINALLPSVRTVIDVGAEESRAIKVSPEGAILDFAVNEKCAAGTGTFIESMARALEITLEDIAKLSLTSNTSIPVNARCVVFAESEVVSLIHRKTPKSDIARAVHDAIAGRVVSMARLVGLEIDIAMVGGMAKNEGFVYSLKRAIGSDLFVPQDPEYIGALGAAVVAASSR